MLFLKKNLDSFEKILSLSTGKNVSVVEILFSMSDGDFLIKIINVLECPPEDLLCDSLTGAVYAHQHNLTKKLEGLNKEQIKLIETTIDSMIVALKKDMR